MPNNNDATPNFPLDDDSFIEKDPEETIELNIINLENVAGKLLSKLPKSGVYDVEDLMQEGYAAILSAASREPKTAFSLSYEYAIARNGMRDAIRKHDHLPQRVRTDLSRMRLAETLFEQEHGRSPTPNELSQATGLTQDRMREAELADYRFREQTIFDIETIYNIPNVDLNTIEEEVERIETQHKLLKAVGSLPEREKITIWGRDMRETPLSFKDIAQMIKTTEKRAQQLHVQAKKRLLKLFLELE